VGHEHVSEGSRSTPLGALIRRERERRGWSRKKLAALVVAAARRDGEVIATIDRAVARWETRGVEPLGPALRALAVVLEQRIEDLTALTRGAGQQPTDDDLDGIGDVDGLWLPPGQPADHEYVQAIHDTIGRLVALEVQHGGDEVAPLARRYLQSVRRRLDAGGHPAALDSDLTAAAGELAEVAGWLAHDAGQQTLARHLNVEALYLTRLAGDSGMERFILANASLMALFTRRPGEARRIAKAMLCADDLTGRERVIFTTRLGRALAQLGDRAEALRAMDEAQATFWDGASGRDPQWTWWVDPAEVRAHVALAHGDLGDSARAADLLQRSVEDCPPRRQSARFIYMAQQLRASVDAGAWSDAETVIEQAVPYIGEVRSGRTLGVLHGGVERIAEAGAPQRLVEAGRHLGEVLTAAG
jgi:transcriptional regulator with XRE-family HTH domain